MVEEWKIFMSKKLENANEKSDFNIHYYGGQIMDSINQNASRKFKDVVQGKNAPEITKYFMAVLHLATTGNVEIIKPSGACLVNDSLQLKLLSRECYHDNLASFTAPSVETFGKRLAKVRALSSSRR